VLKLCNNMSFSQNTIKLSSRSRGCYLITDEITNSLPDLKFYKVGLLNLFLQHTSAGLTLNENWDSDVRDDMIDSLSRMAPEDETLYRHDAEGPDDMPAHIKSSLVGASLTIPIREGRLATGTWQGIWLCEFRRSRHSRNVVATIQGERYKD
jgi:secondary thiamine-phosphate synthase enzyme